MKRHFTATVIMSISMVACSALTYIATPKVKVMEIRDKFDLETMIPMEFEGWKVDSSTVPLQIDPKVQETLNKIYNQTLSRTYVNEVGQRVMLSIAYGGDQGGTLALHKPETCYSAVGFEITNIDNKNLDFNGGYFEVTQLVATRGIRYEPVTYWTIVGDKVVNNGVEQKIQKLRYSLNGTIPDGMLVRVSTQGYNATESFFVQKLFINDMLNAVRTEDKVKFIGKSIVPRV